MLASNESIDASASPASAATKTSNESIDAPVLVANVVIVPSVTVSTDSMKATTSAN